MNETAQAGSVPPELTQDEKAYAGLAHALMISTWWIAPLIIFLMNKESRFVKFHALQALFWQLIFTGLYVAGFIAFFVGMFATALNMPQNKTSHPPFPTTFLLLFPIFWLVIMCGFVITMTLGIMYCLKAMRGEWAGYPLIGRWAKRIAGA